MLMYFLTHTSYGAKRLHVTGKKEKEHEHRITARGQTAGYWSIRRLDRLALTRTTVRPRLRAQDIAYNSFSTPERGIIRGRHTSIQRLNPGEYRGPTPYAPIHPSPQHDFP